MLYTYARSPMIAAGFVALAAGVFPACGEGVGRPADGDDARESSTGVPLETFSISSGSNGVLADINEGGQIVGYGEDADHRFHAFVWTEDDGRVQLEGLRGLDDWSWAHAINDVGQIVGTSNPRPGLRHAVRWTAPDDPVDLTPAYDVPTGANDVSAQGHVVGAADGVAFLWTEEGGVLELGTLGGPFSRAFAINDRGMVVGEAQTSEGNYHAFLWTEATGMEDLGTLGGDESHAYAVNADGQIAGKASTSFGDRAFVWTREAGMVDLGTLGDGGISLAHDLNAHGQVVGVSDTRDGERAFLWSSERGMVNLGTIKEGTSSAASAIDDSGRVVGTTWTPVAGRLGAVWHVQP